jgi:Molybdopterin converting factor, large subunit
VAVHIEVDSKYMDISRLRSIIDSKGCGSVVSFVGLTRDNEDGVPVKGLEFDAWEDELPKVLRIIAEEAISTFGVNSIVISHRTGFVEPGQEIVCIHVGSAHRAEGFTACSFKGLYSRGRLLSGSIKGGRTENSGRTGLG